MPYPSTLQEMIALATAGLQFKTWPYTLDLLPVEGIDDGTQSIGSMRQKLQSTLDILTGIRKGPYGLPSGMAQKLENIRFHVINGIALIDTARRMGHNLRAPYLGNVDGLQAAIDNHVVAIDRARGSWSTWLNDALANKGPNDVLPPPPRPKASLLGYTGYGADAAPATTANTATTTPPATSDPLGGMAKSMSLSDYLAVGIVAGTLLLAMKAVGK